MALFIPNRSFTPSSPTEAEALLGIPELGETVPVWLSMEQGSSLEVSAEPIDGADEVPYHSRRKPLTASVTLAVSGYGDGGSPSEAWIALLTLQTSATLVRLYAPSARYDNLLVVNARVADEYEESVFVLDLEEIFVTSGGRSMRASNIPALAPQAFHAYDAQTQERPLFTDARRSLDFLRF